MKKNKILIPLLSFVLFGSFGINNSDYNSVNIVDKKFNDNITLFNSDEELDFPLMKDEPKRIVDGVEYNFLEFQFDSSISLAGHNISVCNTNDFICQFANNAMDNLSLSYPSGLSKVGAFHVSNGRPYAPVLKKEYGVDVPDSNMKFQFIDIKHGRNYDVLILISEGGKDNINSNNNQYGYYSTSYGTLFYQGYGSSKRKIENLDYITLGGSDDLFDIRIDFAKCKQDGKYVSFYALNSAFGNRDNYQMDIDMYNNSSITIYANPRESIQPETVDLFLGLNEVTEENIKTLFSAEDILGRPVELQVDSSDYQMDKPGNYTIVYRATDEWDNSTTLTVNITVTDYRPKIELIDNASDKINVLYSQNTTEQNIKDLFRVTDYNGDSIPTSSIKFDKPFDSRKIGETKYNLTVYSVKNPKYFTTKEVTINVKQDVPPVILISDKVIMTSIDNPLSYDSIVDVISYVEKVPVLQLYNLKVENYEQYKSNYDKSITINYSYLNEEKEVLGQLYLKPESQEAQDLSNLSLWEKLGLMWQDYLSQCKEWYDYFWKFFTFVIPSFFKILFGAM